MTWGIGLVVGSHWAAWCLVDGWKAAGRDIGWAESIALEIAVLWALASGLTDAELVIRGDNISVICAFQKGHSQNLQRNDSIRRITSSLVPSNVIIKPIHVASEDNKADRISRGTFGSLSDILPCIFSLPAKISAFFNHVNLQP